jgi:hypothetical protein
MHFTYVVTLMGPGGKQQPDILIIIIILVFTHLRRGQNGLVVAPHHVGRGGGGWANQELMISWPHPSRPMNGLYVHCVTRPEQ